MISENSVPVVQKVQIIQEYHIHKAHLEQSLEGRVLRGVLDEGEGEVRDELLLVAQRRPLAIQELLNLVKALCRRRQAVANLSTTAGFGTTNGLRTGI